MRTDTKNHVTEGRTFLGVETPALCGSTAWASAFEWNPESPTFRNLVKRDTQNDCPDCFRIARQKLHEMAT